METSKISSPAASGKFSFSLLDLVERDTTLRRVAATHGGEYAGSCPGCGGRDRFRVWPHRGRWWCRGCNRRGDAIQFLRDFHGYSFRAAKEALGLDPSRPPPAQLRAHRAKRTALASIKHAYHAWERRKFITLSDAYRDLLTEKDVAETGYRLAHQHPDWFDDESYSHLVRALGRIYDTLAMLEHDLDILTFSDGNRKARFDWWRSEQKGEHHE
jgi:CHC2 zinc finger